MTGEHQERLMVGQRVGRYQILSLLGAGGMGEVYRARDTLLNREVAIKVLPSHLTQDETALARFQREAQAVATLSHPNVLAIHDFGEEQGIHYAVMELLEGEPLRARLTRGAVPWREAVEIAAAVADALTATHAKGIIHRDLKPENVFLTRDGRVKILDFGVARKKPPAVLTRAGTSPSVQVTAPGVVLGTVGYMSPEQVCGERADERSDIFSFGCVLYEMVTGQRAFGRPTVAESTLAILQQAAPKVQGQTVPARLEAVIDRCLKKDASERYQSARDLTSDLDALIGAPAPVAVRLPARTSARLRPAVWAGLPALLIAGFLLYQTLWQKQPGDEPIESIAVLPLVNASANAEMDYLSDGLTEDLINSLSHVSNLRVIARTTVFRYKGRQVDPLQAGSELKVRAVVTGRVLLRGDQLSIQADLIDVASGAQLWGERFNQRLTDIFDLQAVIAQRITNGLHLELPGALQQRLAKRYTENVEAYQLYLRGRREALKFNQEGRENAPGYFEQAIRLDPNYALAYAGLAEYHVIYPHFSKAAAAKEAALKARALDETLAEAHSALASVADFYEWDWAQAEREYQRAIALNPGSAVAHHWFGIFLAKLGRFDEARAELQLALQLDPLAVAIYSDLGRVDYAGRRYGQAITQFLKALELDPDYWLAHVYLGLTYAQQAKHQEALAEFQKATSPSSYAPDGRTWLVYGLIMAGRRGEARKLLEQLEPSERVPWSMAAVHTALGDKDGAFAWLDQAAAERFGVLASITSDPAFDSLRSDPRYAALLRRMGLAG